MHDVLTLQNWYRKAVIKKNSYNFSIRGYAAIADYYSMAIGRFDSNKL